jgi:hypothetical protein
MLNSLAGAGKHPGHEDERRFLSLLHGGHFPFVKDAKTETSGEWKSTTVSLYNKPTLQELETLDLEFLGIQRKLNSGPFGECSCSPSTLLVFRNPSVESLGKVIGYEGHHIHKLGLYDYNISRIIGKFEDVHISYGVLDDIDEVIRDNVIALRVPFHDPEKPKIIVPSLEIWQKLDKHLGPVFPVFVAPEEKKATET